MPILIYQKKCFVSASWTNAKQMDKWGFSSLKYNIEVSKAVQPVWIKWVVYMIIISMVFTTLVLGSGLFL